MGMMLDSIDRDMLLGIRNSKGNLLERGKVIRSAMQEALGMRIPYETKEGERVELSAKEALILATLTDAIKDPSTGKLKDIMEITGEIDKYGDGGNGNPLADLLSDIVVEVPGEEIASEKEEEGKPMIETSEEEGGTE